MTLHIGCAGSVRMGIISHVGRHKQKELCSVQCWQVLFWYNPHTQTHTYSWKYQISGVIPDICISSLFVLLPQQFQLSVLTISRALAAGLEIGSGNQKSMRHLCAFELCSACLIGVKGGYSCNDSQGLLSSPLFSFPSSY